MLLAAVILSQAIPPDAQSGYLWAWIAVAFIGGTPGVIGAVLASSTAKKVDKVRTEVMPNGGSSSFDLTHRLLWQIHEKTDSIDVRVRSLEQSTREK